MATWIRLEVAIARNPKVLRLTSTNRHRAAWLYLSALLHCGEQNTSGYIDPAALRLLDARRQDVDALVDVGLWHPDADGHGWIVHAWDEYQPSFEAARKRSAQASKAAAARWKQ